MRSCRIRHSAAKFPVDEEWRLLYSIAMLHLVILRPLAVVLVCLLLWSCQQHSKEQQREIDAIKRQVLENPESIDRDSGQGTPLEVATLNGYLDLAEWLVEYHTNVNLLG